MRTMSNSTVLRYVLSGLVGLLMGVVFTAILRLLSPAGIPVRTAVLICMASIFSAFSGYLLGARTKG